MPGKKCAEGKARYETHHVATKVLIGIAWKRHRRPQPGRPLPVRAYLCPYCKQWHITSQERNPNAEKRMKANQKRRQMAAKRAAETPLFHRLVTQHALRGDVFLYPPQNRKK